MKTILDITTMLGCHMKLTEFQHDGPCYQLSLDMGPHDGRRAHVLLSEDDLTAIVRAVREHDER